MLYPPEIPAGIPASNPLWVCPKKGGTVGILAGISAAYPDGIPAGITVGYYVHT